MGCLECTLEGKKKVPSENNGARIVLLAEAPGGDEEKQGKPLVGSAGKKLFELLEETGFTRKDFNLVNICSCRPTVEGYYIRNRKPTQKEVECCSGRLVNDIDSMNPDVIVVMGLTAYSALTGNQARMKDIVGSNFKWRGYSCYVTYHPASMLYADAAQSSFIRSSIQKTISLAYDTISKEETKGQMKLL